MVAFQKVIRHCSGTIVERLEHDFGMGVDRYVSMYNGTSESRKYLKELAAIFFRLPVGDKAFKITTALPEDQLLPLLMSIIVNPFFWDKTAADAYKEKIISRRSKSVLMRRYTAQIASKYPHMCWNTYTGLFRFLIVRLPPYQQAKLPERVTSEELPDFLDAVGVRVLCECYSLEELFLAFVLLGYPVYHNPGGEGWNVGLQVLGVRSLANSLSKRSVGKAKVDAQGNFDSTEV